MNSYYTHLISTAIQLSDAMQLPVAPDTACAFYGGARPLAAVDLEVPTSMTGESLLALQRAHGLLPSEIRDRRAVTDDGIQVFFRVPLRRGDCDARTHTLVALDTVQGLADLELPAGLPTHVRMPSLQTVLKDKMTLVTGRGYAHDFLDLVTLTAAMSPDELIEAAGEWASEHGDNKSDHALQRLVLAMRNPIHDPEGGDPGVLAWCCALHPTTRIDCDVIADTLGAAFQPA